MYGVVFARKPDGTFPDTRKLGKAGIRILGTLDTLARHFGHDIEITCANEGHSLPDPHPLGEAFDIRTHNWPDDHKQAVLHELAIALADDPVKDAPKAVSIGLATLRFYSQLEDPRGPNEHIHAQRRNSTVY
jgi:hypothetical protein